MGNQNARSAQRTTSDKTIPPAERNDRWLTPLPIIEALTTDIGYRRFDMDPCAAPGHDTANNRILLEEGGDGLRDSWLVRGVRQPKMYPSLTRVWMNPPYGREKLAWIDKFIAEWGAGRITGTMLIPADPGQVEVWQDRMFPLASSILFWRHRINFVSRDDKTGKGMVSVNESAIVAFGQYDADALWTAVQRQLLPGTVIDFTGVSR